MAEKDFLTGQSSPRIRIDLCGGNLVLEGWDEPRVQYRGDRLKEAREEGGTLTLAGAGDMDLSVPIGSVLSVGSVAGDFRLRDVQGDSSVERIHGDAQIRQCGGVELGRVDGELDARRLAGGLRAQRVSGDVDLRQLDGAVSLSCEGDVRINAPLRRADLTASGDVMLVLSPDPGTESRIRAGGDLRCFVPADSSVRAELRAGGDAYIQPPFRAEPPGATDAAVLGDGGARLLLESGGDCYLGGWMSSATGSDWETVGRDLGQMGVEFGALASEFGIWMERNMREKFGDLEKNLRRKMNEHDYARVRRKGAWDSPASARASEPTPAQGARESRRLEILEMLQRGSINVDEAEKLLAALERGG